MQENVISSVSVITQKNFGATIDNKFNFKSHISEYVKRLVTALSKLTSYLLNSEKKINFQLDNKVTIYLLSSSMDFLLENIEQHH